MSTEPTAEPGLPDNRVRFPAPPIDFTDDVGDTGQDHDEYPYPETQARYDWMRMFLIGLLANQASYDEPVNYRKGSFWLDLNTLMVKIRLGDGVAGTHWSDLAEVVQVSEGLSLQDWFDAVVESLADRMVSVEELRVALSSYFTADASYNITSFTMASPSGNRYKVTISDSGSLVTTPL
jgi:hypothetical protein